MANAVYPLGRQRILEKFLAGTNPASLDFYVVGVSSGYVYSAAHEVIADVTPAAIIAAELALTSETVLADGIFDADDVLFEGLTNGLTLDAVVVYAKWTGGSLLLAYIDSSVDASLPQLIEGTKATVTWNASGIFRL